MRTIEIEVQNKLGIHARPAALLVQTAASFQCDIMIVKDNSEVNAKSVMGVMMLAAGFGTILKITARGEDEEQALSAIKNLFDGKFGEE